ncbi:trypsin-like serine peptidase [Sphingomonas jinjuensis]|uniref:trypsin-like serine peptidase n=1 Tax=Sphingomonas jinjuensis TaxID=535907 RepID=UPI001C8482DB|nr:serine protease [Sphingomonas jinjuensis]
MTDDVIDQLAQLVATTSEQFGRTFNHAQAGRDDRVDLAVVANADPSVEPVVACLRFARVNGFAKHLLRCCIDDQVAGPLTLAEGRTFADLCRLHAGIETPVDPGSMAQAVAALEHDTAARERRRALDQGYRPEAINETGFDCNAKQHGEQVQSTMAMVCRIDDSRGNVLGSGILIAPHLVATAAHVVERHVDASGIAKPEGAKRIKVKLNALSMAANGEAPVDLDADWLAGFAPSDHRPGDDGRMSLPPAHDLIDSHDVAILRLKGAPGWLRGWIDVEGARAEVDPARTGLCFHHHPGGAAQSISIGSHLGGHGCRFLHSCSSIPGSSGGPLLDHDARLVGLHHGCLEDEPDTPNLGGGGGWLADWWAAHPDLRVAPPEVSPFWEIRSSGPVGSGEPVIGFDAMQQRVWDAQRHEDPVCAVTTIPAYAGRILGSLISKMLPSDRAQVVTLSRADLNGYVTAAVNEANPVTAMLAAMAGRLGAPAIVTDPARSSEKVATDPVNAAQYANELADRLLRMQTFRTLWLVVNVGDGNLPSAMSEALGYLYRTVVSLPRGRGKLVIVGSDPLIRAAVAGLMEDVVQVVEWPFHRPDDAALERFILRWCRETRQTQRVQAGAIEFMDMFRSMADAAVETEFGGDWYAALCASLRRNLIERNAR